MDRNDQQAIQSLFGKLADVERQAPPRDAQAEAFIKDQIATQPGAPYFMAQTIVMQEQALIAAQSRIEQLEARPAGGGGLFASLFGGGNRQQPPRRAPQYAPQQQQPMGGGGGGGFLAGAAQTAMGVAGGVLLGNAIMGMFDGGEAQAAEAPMEEDPGADDMSFDDGGGFGDEF